MCTTAVIASMLVIAGCGGGDSETDATGTAADTTPVVTDTTSVTESRTPTQTAPAQGCLSADQQPDPGQKEQFEKAEDVLTPGPATLIMETSCGPLTIELDREAGGPIPNSIAFLASKGFYDGLSFHRVVPDFVLQGGAPDGNGSGGPGYEVVGPVPQGYEYRLGDVAMAKTPTAPAGASGSQFFVVSSENGAASLSMQPDYGILGRATDPRSLKTIQNIADLAITDGPPSQPVWIISARVEQ